MGWKCGIVGLPNSGKSTLFNALVGSGAQVAPYPFTTIDPNIGVVSLEDPRLFAVGRIARSKKVTPTAIEVVDIAGLVKGAHTGEGLGNRFLSHIRGVDAIFHVVRTFENPEVPHTLGRIDPVDDAQVVDLELVMADLEVVERRLERVSKAYKAREPVKAEFAALTKARDALVSGKPARLAGLTQEEERAVQGMLLTTKPCVYVANVSEEFHDDVARAQGVKKLADYAASQGCQVTGLSCKIEAELAELLPQEAADFRSMLGIKTHGAQNLILLGYKILDLLTFFTANENETRAWTLRRGSTAIEAAAKVHSAMAAGFIKAEVTPADELIKAGSFAEAKAVGVTRVEGRDYVIEDGDVILIRFAPS